MLPKNRRIKKQLYALILSKGKKIHSPHFVLYVCKQEDNTKSQFSFSISKKIFKKAVDRNKYRRRGYSVVAKHIKNVKDGYLFFFSFKKGAYPVSFGDLNKEIQALLQNFI